METTTTVPLFESNQILSSTHLNQLRDYLDNEIRISRTKLSGVGIADGLSIKLYDKAAGKIVVSAGYGITTDGYLLELHSDNSNCENVYTHFRAYTDPGKPLYNFGKASVSEEVVAEEALSEVSAKKSSSSKSKSASFKPQSIKPAEEAMAEVTDSEGSGDSPKTISVGPTLYELFTDGSEDDTEPLTDFPADLDAMALVLFMEEKDVNLKSCTGTNCDNKGQKREVTVRLLLIDPKYLNSYDTLDILTSKDPLHHLNIPRLSNTDLVSFDSIAKVQEKYLAKIITPQKTVLNEAITLAYTSYNYLLALSGQNYNEALAQLGSIEKAKDANGLVIGNIQYIQYVADVLADTTMAFNEFASAAYNFLSRCGKAPKAFSRHLTLGLLVKPVSNYADIYRTVFFNMPPLDRQDHLFLSAQMLFQKMLRLLINFQVPGENPADAPNPHVNITPDKTFPLPLTDRSIPFYYKADKLKNDLVPFWNPEQTMHGRQSERMGFYAVKYTKPDQAYFRNPFDYSVHEYPFLRVEAINGKKKEDVLSTLSQLKDDYNLPFGVIALQLENNPGPVSSDYDCGYEDLQLVYLEVRAELLCALKHGEDALQPLIDAQGNMDDFFLADINSYISNPQGNIQAFLNAYENIQSIYTNLGTIFGSAGDTDLFTRTYNNLPYFIHQFHYPTFLNNYKELQGFLIRVRAVYAHLQRMVNIWYYYLELPGYIHSAISKIDWLISILDRLLNQCSYIKLSIAYYTFEWRKSYFLPKQHVFKEFAKDHPGMEHCRGTEKGSTLVLLYSTTTKIYSTGPTHQVIADFMLPGTCCSPCGPTPLVQIDLPPVAMHNYTEISVSGLNSNPNGIYIDVLKNDYSANSSVVSGLTASASISDDYYSLEIVPDNGEMNYTPNAGTITVSADPNDGGRLKLLYKNPGGKATIDFFRYKVKRNLSNGTSWEDSGLVVMNVIEPVTPLLNAKADTASTMEGRKVIIWPALNDIPATSQVELIDNNGNAVISELATTYGKVTSKWDNQKGPYLEYNPSGVKNPPSTLTDVFFYRLKNADGQKSQPAPVTVYILPAHTMASDFASVLVGKTVRIDVLVNDGSPYDGNGELILLDSNGNPVDPASFVTVEGGKLSIGGDPGKQYFDYQAPVFLSGKQSTATDHFNYCVRIDGELSIPAVATVYILKETPHNNDIAATVPGKDVIIDVLQNDMLPFPIEKARIRFIDANGDPQPDSTNSFTGKYGTVKVIYDGVLKREVLIYTAKEAKLKQTQLDTFSYFATEASEIVSIDAEVSGKKIQAREEEIASDPGLVSVYVLPQQNMVSDFAAVMTGKKVIIDPLANDGDPYDSEGSITLLDDNGDPADPEVPFITEIGASVEVQLDEKLGRDILIYTAPALLSGKQETATDQFRYMAKAKDHSSTDSMVTVYVLKAQQNNSNTATTSPGKAVTIDVLSYDVLPFPPKDATLLLLDASGKATQATQLSGSYGSIEIITDPVTDRQMLSYTASSAKPTQTVYDVFGYQAVSGKDKADPGFVTVYVVPVAADSTGDVSFALPKYSYFRTDNPASFRIDAAEELLPLLAIDGPGVYFDGSRWKYDPQYGLVVSGYNIIGQYSNYQQQSNSLKLYNIKSNEYISEIKTVLTPPMIMFDWSFFASDKNIQLNLYTQARGTVKWVVDGVNYFPETLSNSVTVTIPLSHTSATLQFVVGDKGNEFTVQRQLFFTASNISIETIQQLGQKSAATLNTLDGLATDTNFIKLVVDRDGKGLSYLLSDFALQLKKGMTTVQSTGTLPGEYSALLANGTDLQRELTKAARRMGPASTENEIFYKAFRLYLLNILAARVLYGEGSSYGSSYEDGSDDRYALLNIAGDKDPGKFNAELISLIQEVAKGNPVIRTTVVHLISDYLLPR